VDTPLQAGNQPVDSSSAAQASTNQPTASDKKSIPVAKLHDGKKSIPVAGATEVFVKYKCPHCSTRPKSYKGMAKHIAENHPDEYFKGMISVHENHLADLVNKELPEREKELQQNPEYLDLWLQANKPGAPQYLTNEVKKYEAKRDELKQMIEETKATLDELKASYTQVKEQRRERFAQLQGFAKEIQGKIEEVKCRRQNFSSEHSSPAESVVSPPPPLPPRRTSVSLIPEPQLSSAPPPPSQTGNILTPNMAAGALVAGMLYEMHSQKEKKQHEELMKKIADLERKK
jgi:hypothetical protein